MQSTNGQHLSAISMTGSHQGASTVPGNGIMFRSTQSSADLATQPSGHADPVHYSRAACAPSQRLPSTTSLTAQGHSVGGKLSGRRRWLEVGALWIAGLHTPAVHSTTHTQDSCEASPRLRSICGYLKTTPALLAERDSRLWVVLIAQYPVMWTMLLCGVRSTRHIDGSCRGASRASSP
jgi:hypothetical protein